MKKHFFLFKRSRNFFYVLIFGLYSSFLFFDTGYAFQVEIQDFRNSLNSAQFNGSSSLGNVTNSGDLNFSITLFDVPAGGELDFPITLSYSNAGIKPGGRSGIVGYGWNINLNNEVRRQIRDVVDEQDYFNFSSSWGDFGNQNFGLPYSVCEPYNLALPIQQWPQSVLGGCLHSDKPGVIVSKGRNNGRWNFSDKWDYYWLSTPYNNTQLIPHFLDGSYTYTGLIPTLDANTEVPIFQEKPYRNGNIEVDFDPSTDTYFQSFTYTDSKGRKFEYDDAFNFYINDWLYYDQNNPNDGSLYFKAPIKWKLTSITSPTSNESIQFNYDYYAHPSHGEYPINYSGSRNIFLYGENTFHLPTTWGASPSLNYLNGGNNVDVVASYLYFEKSILNEIVTPSYKVIIINEDDTSNEGVSTLYDNINSETVKAKRIEEIQLVERQTNQVIKKVKFIYSSSIQRAEGSGTDALVTMLDEIQFMNKDGEIEREYSFDYFNATNLSPVDYFNYYGDDNFLKKITLPEGGTITYAYEDRKYSYYYEDYYTGTELKLKLNYVSNNSDLKYTEGKRISSITSDPINGDPQVVQYEYGDGVKYAQSATSSIKDDLSTGDHTYPLYGKVDYRWIKEVNSDQGFTKTYYTNALSHSTAHSDICSASGTACSNVDIEEARSVFLTTFDYYNPNPSKQSLWGGKTFVYTDNSEMYGLPYRVEVGFESGGIETINQEVKNYYSQLYAEFNSRNPGPDDMQFQDWERSAYIYKYKDEIDNEDILSTNHYIGFNYDPNCLNNGKLNPNINLCKEILEDDIGVLSGPKYTVSVLDDISEIRILEHHYLANRNDDAYQENLIDYKIGGATLKDITSSGNDLNYILSNSLNSGSDYFTMDLTKELDLEILAGKYQNWDKSDTFLRFRNDFHLEQSGLSNKTSLPGGQYIEFYPELTGSSSVVRATFLSYDTYGNPLEVEDGMGEKTKFFFGSNSSPFSQSGINGINGAYLTGIQKVQGTEDVIPGAGTRPISGDDLFSEAEYDNSGRLTKVIDENEKAINYDYDSFNRLNSTINHLGGVSKNSYFYTTVFDGTYSYLAPNYMETISGTDSFVSDFSTSSVFIKSGDYTFNHNYNGEITLRLGKTSSGGWSYVYRYPVEKNLAVKIDFNPSSNYTSSVHPYAIALNDGSSGAPNRCSIRYNPSTDKLYVYRRKNNDSWDTGTIFTLNAPPDKWYTLEIEKNNGVCMYWVYERGKSRSSGEYYQETGFPDSWKPQVRSWSQDDYIYLSNLEFTVDPQSSITYRDGLGREIQTQAKGGNNTVVTGIQYNDSGLPEASSKPIIMTNRNTYVDYLFTGTSGSFNPENPSGLAGIGSPIEQYYTGLGMGTDADFAYSYIEYESSALQRPVLSTLPGADHKFGSGKELSTTYGVNTTETFTINGKTWGLNSLRKTVTKDPDGKEKVTYTDGWGQTIVSGVNMNPSTDDALDDVSDLITKYEYDLQGNLTRTEDPRGLVTTYTYNSLNQLTQKKLPDQTHPHHYRYDDKGRLRFHKDPVLDASNDHYYYTKYDDLDRPTEIGKRNTSNDFNDENDINNQSFPTSSYTAYTRYFYDGDSPLSGHTPNNTKGRLTRSTYKDPNSSYWGSTYYSYNSLGLVEWVIQQPAQPTSSNNRKIEYTYDELGRMTRLYFNPLSSSSDDHYFWYYYDELGRPEKVTSYSSSLEGSALTEAEYTYYAEGQVEQLTLGDGAQVVDYDYTIQGWLEDINDGGISGADQFGVFLDYANNGNVSHQQWSQKAFSTGTYNYFYGYDSANRLKEACYGSTNSCTSTGDYDVTYGYDKSGNIDYISRNGAGSDPDIEYYISFVSGTNKVNDVLVDGVSSATKNYSYDASGNVTQNEVQGITSTTYDWRNLPTSLSANGSTLTYIYDADGNRVKKKFGSSEIWYVRGADGQTIAAYQGSTLLYINILAGGQIIGQIEN